MKNMCSLKEMDMNAESQKSIAKKFGISTSVTEVENPNCVKF